MLAQASALLCVNYPVANSPFGERSRLLFLQKYLIKPLTQWSGFDIRDAAWREHRKRMSNPKLH